MNKYQDDQWFSNPPSIRSAFILQLKEIKDEITTGVCGFGWHFRLSKIHSSTTFASSKLPPESTKIRLEIMVNSSISIRGTGIDSRAPVTIKISGFGGNLPGEIEQKHSVDFGMTYCHSWSSLGEYACVASTPLICFIHVEFPQAADLHLPTTPPPSTLSFLGDSVLGLDRTDTKFYLFSRRNKAGRKTHPLPIFASSQILRGKSSCLDTLLTIPGFKESALVDIDSTPLDLANFSDAGFDYDSDSDLDPDDGDEKPSALDSSNPVGDSESLSRSHLGPEILSETRASGRIGRIVYIPDTSYKTWQALIWYLYTSKIDFLPLRSLSQDISPTTVNVFRPACSPKSMYRLADKLGIPELRSLSLTAISSGITHSNVVQESFCRFTSLYPEVQEVESDLLISHFASIPPSKFDRVHQLLSEGEHPHSLALLWKITQKSLKLSGMKPASPQVVVQSPSGRNRGKYYG
ncbi:hypothetical protein BD779DRAFT_957281 [Infundibulicybe gibba]|nr:hypothetical protein BD779DRAFT_957281 [Infundibulicybe gibba]